MKYTQVTISPAATELIRSRIRDAGIEDPVVSFVGQTEPVQTHRALVDALLRNAEDEEMRSLIRRFESPDSLPVHWSVMVHSSRDIPEESLVVCGGLKLCLAAEQFGTSAEWTIDVHGAHLLIADARGNQIEPPRPKVPS